MKIQPARFAVSLALLQGLTLAAWAQEPSKQPPLEMPKAVAICWWDCWPSNLRRKASLSLRMLILGAGIAVLKKRIDANPTEI